MWASSNEWPNKDGTTRMRLKQGKEEQGMFAAVTGTSKGMALSCFDWSWWCVAVSASAQGLPFEDDIARIILRHGLHVALLYDKKNFWFEDGIAAKGRYGSDQIWMHAGSIWSCLQQSFLLDKARLIVLRLFPVTCGAVDTSWARADEERHSSNFPSLELDKESWRNPLKGAKLF